MLSGCTFGNLQLTVAEPLLATNLILALIVAIPLSGVRPRKSEIIGAVLLSLGGRRAVRGARRSTPAGITSGPPRTGPPPR